MRTSDRGYTPDTHPCRGYGLNRCEYEDCPSNARWGHVTLYLMTHPRHFWRVANDDSLPGNYLLITRRIDLLGIVALLVAMTFVGWGGHLIVFLVCAFCFAFGWQYHWIQRIRVIRKQQASNEDEP